MRCKFTFSVHGTLTLDEDFPIETKFHRYEFVREENLVTHIAVSLSVPNKSDWPGMVMNPALGVKLGLRFSTPQLPFVQLELRTLQGALAPYGVRAIDLEEPLIEWLAENDEERHLMEGESKESSSHLTCKPKTAGPRRASPARWAKLGKSETEQAAHWYAIESRNTDGADSAVRFC
jgi:hypothetical protein